MRDRKAEMEALLKEITKIDKKVDWREKRIEQDRQDIAELMAKRESLAWRYRELNMEGDE